MCFVSFEFFCYNIKVTIILFGVEGAVLFKT